MFPKGFKPHGLSQKLKWMEEYLSITEHLFLFLNEESSDHTELLRSGKQERQRKTFYVSILEMVWTIALSAKHA